MGPLTVCCVWQGDKYPLEYVERLRNMVRRHLPIPHRFVCYTDRPERLPGIEYVTTGHAGLPGWWGKIAVFAPMFNGRRLYFDLDTVIVGDLTPLAEWSGRFAICANFTRWSGHRTYPCRYGSCVMSFGPGFSWSAWESLYHERESFMRTCRYGDQEAIEAVVPDATLLQDVMPAGFFLGYRALTAVRPEGCAVVVFAGSHKPHDCPHQWIREAWV